MDFLRWHIFIQSCNQNLEHFLALHNSTVAHGDDWVENVNYGDEIPSNIETRHIDIMILSAEHNRTHDTQMNWNIYHDQIIIYNPDLFTAQYNVYVKIFSDAKLI